MSTDTDAVTPATNATTVTTDGTAGAAPSVTGPFPIKLRGYDRHAVDAQLLADERSRAELTAAIADRDMTITRMGTDLEQARKELRYWHDRQAFIDGELERAHTAAARIIEEATERAAAVESAAQERAAALETSAQERTLQMVDRVCSEANEIMRHAREEAVATVTRYDDDVDLAQRRLERLAAMQRDVLQSMRAAMAHFDEGITDLELVTPRSLAPRHETPTRRITSTLDTRSKVTLGQSAVAAAVSAATTATPVSTDPATETFRLLTEGAPLR